MMSGKKLWSLWISLPNKFLQDRFKPRQYQGYFLSLVNGSIIKKSETIVAATQGSLIFRDKFHSESQQWDWRTWPGTKISMEPQSLGNYCAFSFQVLLCHFVFLRLLLLKGKKKKRRAFSSLSCMVKSLKAFYFHLAQILLRLIPAHPPCNSKSRLCVKNAKRSVHMYIIFKRFFFPDVSL